MKAGSSSLHHYWDFVFNKLYMTSKESFTSRRDDIISRNSSLMLFLILFGSFLVFAVLIASL